MSSMIGFTRAGVLLALATVFLAAPIVSSAQAQEFERAPIVLRASEVLKGDLLSGPNYRVKDTVISDGMVNVYELETFYGPLKVESTALLMKRINELKAIHNIEQLKGTKTYMDAFKKAASAPVETAKGLVTDPVGTVSGVATGIGRFFSNIERSVTTKDPYEAKGAKAILGQATYKRQFAYQFNVDPYSSYAPLQKALDDLSWTATAGGLTVKAATMAIPGAAGAMIGMGGTAQSLKALVSEKTPGELEEINRSKLAGMGVSPEAAQAFLNNMTYDPLEKTLLVGSLANMPGLMGAEIYILKAAAAHGESVALFMRVRAQLMEAYFQKEGSVASIVEADGTPLLLTKDGRVVGTFPIDYLAWTRGLEQKGAGISSALLTVPGITGKEIWITGKVDPVARRAMEKRGWKVEDDILDRFFSELYR